MPEDGIPNPGWVGKGAMFEDELVFIVNRNAQDHSFRQLSQKIMNETALDHLGTARAAVQEAAFRKAGLPYEEPNDPRDGVAAADFVPGDDFWL